MGNPNIGDASFYMSMTKNIDVGQFRLRFIQKNYMVQIEVLDEKDKSLNEAIRIAKIVNRRLD